MANWSKNNRACKTTWTTLRVLEQNSKAFVDTGDVTMKDLTYWNATATADMREFQAEVLATQIDNVFRLIRKARYEDGVDKEKAVSDMSGVLKSEGCLVAIK